MVRAIGISNGWRLGAAQHPTSRRMAPPTMRTVNRAEAEHPDGHKALKLRQVPVALGSGSEEQGAGQLTALFPGPSTQSP